MAVPSFAHMYNLDAQGKVVGIVWNGPPVSDPNNDGQWSVGESVMGGFQFLGVNRFGEAFVSTGATFLLSNNAYGFGATTDSYVSGSYTFTAPPVCFCGETKIALDSGETTASKVKINDRVKRWDGTYTRVKWMGRLIIDTEVAIICGYLPVKISAGAISVNMPSRDLFVSPDHALLIDGHLVHASALINGVTIIQMEDWDGPVEYYHIETENHELIIAEGLPAETFIDNVSREKFDNYAEYLELYPNAQPMVELDLPRVMFRRQLPKAIAQRLDDRVDAVMEPGARTARITPDAAPVIVLRRPAPSVHV